MRTPVNICHVPKSTHTPYFPLVTQVAACSEEELYNYKMGNRARK